MSTPYGPFHRVGSPGGPGCPVGELPIRVRRPDGSLGSAVLLDAGLEANELELLRTVAEGLGVRWGRDDLGWWAVVPSTTDP
jgi:hypothetical protein